LLFFRGYDFINPQVRLAWSPNVDVRAQLVRAQFATFNTLFVFI